MNMKKEYRSELRQLARAERKLKHDWATLDRSNKKQISTLQLQCARGFRSVSRELDRLYRRRDILKARLAS